jgi:predicted NBD/HSP70 family sugar kinase
MSADAREADGRTGDLVDTPRGALRRPSTERRGQSSAARQESLREHNLHVVLDRVLNADRPMSRADIATTTGLTRGAVSDLVDRLIAAGLIAELPPFRPQNAGRPAVPLVPARGTMAAIGAEVNVDSVGVLALDLAGDLLARRQITGDFRGSDPTTVLARLVGLVADVLTDLAAGPGRPPRTVGMGLALPGLVDRGTGPLRLAPNLGWRDVDVVALLETHEPLRGLPIRLANEANLAAHAELRAEGADRSFLYVSGEVGIGAAIVLDGEVFVGRHGWSGELGHTVVDLNGPRCSCGATGCLEQYVGKDALMRAAGLDLALPIEALRASADAGDPAATGALAAGGRALGVAIANFVNLVDVEQVVLGGIYAPLVDHLAPEVTKELHTRVLSASWAHARVRAARVGNDAAMTGAALAVMSTVIADPAAWVPLKVAAAR